jgi:hypothetical protein
VLNDVVQQALVFRIKGHIPLKLLDKSVIHRSALSAPQARASAVEVSFDTARAPVVTLTYVKIPAAPRGK